MSARSGRCFTILRVAIVDDEPEVCSLLVSYVERYGKEQGTEFAVRTFKNGIALLNEDRLDFHIVFLDVEMPYMDGIETARNLRKSNRTCALIFVTNMTQYAIAGYEVDAMDYVVKPVSYEVFAFKMKRILERVALNESKNLTIKTREGFVYLDIQDIYYIEVTGHELRYHTAQGVLSTWGSLSEAEKQLGEDGFYRSNSCYLINLRYVSAVEEDCAVVHGDHLRISGPRKKGFYQAMMRYMRG